MELEGAGAGGSWNREGGRRTPPRESPCVSAVRKILYTAVQDSTVQCSIKQFNTVQCTVAKSAVLMATV